MDDDVLRDFINESREHLSTIETDLLVIEEGGANVDRELVNKVFRAAHSIKGGSAFFGLNKVKELAHKAETVLDMLRSGKMEPNAEITNVLLAAFDRLRDMINDTANSDKADVSELLVSLTGLASSYLPADQKASLHSNVRLESEDGKVEASLPQTDVDRSRRTGRYIYLVDCDLIHDIERKGVDVLTLFRKLTTAGEVLDCVVDTESVGTLDDPIGTRIPLRIVVATVAEPRIVGGLFPTIAEDRIHLLMRPGAQRAPAASAKAPVAAAEASAAAPAAVAVAVQEALPAEPAPTSVVPASSAHPPRTESAVASASAETLRVNVQLLENLMNLAGELVLSRNQLHAAVAQDNRILLSSVDQRVNQVTAEIQDVIMQTRLQPIGNVFSKFPRVVRDLSQALGKDIQLDVQGKDVALDKTLIEGLSDPLTHMVRNAVDHGVETVQERLASGKPAAGRVRIEARHEAGQVVVEISDDGKGLDPERIAASAVSKGLLAPERAAALTTREKQNLIFLPGLSTAKTVSDVSGRGVGMDVVKTNLDRLGGQVEIVSTVGRGSTFLIKLPLTLAIIPSLIVSVKGERFALPQANIRELLRLRANEIPERIEKVGNVEVLLLRDRVLPLARFEQFMEAREEQAGGTGAMEIAVVSTGRLDFGLVVGAFHDTEEIVVKPLGRRLKSLREYSGATILGDGTVALILDVGGVASKAGLEEKAESARELEERKAREEAEIAKSTQSLLLFHNGPEEPCAVPLDLVQRIERISPDQVERLANLRTMQYRGGSLTLVALSDVAKMDPVDGLSNLVVLVSAVHGREVGLLGCMPVDVVETGTKIDLESHRQRGIAGSAIVRDRTTLVVDLVDLVDAVHPEWAEDSRRLAGAQPKRLGAGPPARSGELVDLGEFALETQGGATTEGAGRGETVLLAEDSDFFRAQVKRYLAEDGYNVLEAPDGQAAWELLVDNLDRVKVVVTDIEMPRLTGLGLSEKIRKDDRTAALPVIAVTSLAGEEDTARGKAAGIDDYQVKLDREKLLASVRRMLNRQNNVEGTKS
jgi:two-component system, chemotaxis family, sensor kinase CheA